MLYDLVVLKSVDLDLVIYLNQATKAPTDSRGFKLHVLEYQIYERPNTTFPRPFEIKNIKLTGLLCLCDFKVFIRDLVLILLTKNIDFIIKIAMELNLKSVCLNNNDRKQQKKKG